MKLSTSDKYTKIDLKRHTDGAIPTYRVNVVYIKPFDVEAKTFEKNLETRIYLA